MLEPSSAGLTKAAPPNIASTASKSLVASKQAKAGVGNDNPRHIFLDRTLSIANADPSTRLPL